jgi:hypothetical protein
MKRNILHLSIVSLVVVVLFSNCSKSKDDFAQPAAESKSTLKATGSWYSVFTEDFSSTSSLTSNWQRVVKTDANSTYTNYTTSQATVAKKEGKNCLVITAIKSGSTYKSGFVKSNYTFKPETNTEYRFTSYVKLVAVNGTAYVPFSSTYGVWPAVWTTNETYWPCGGEIDIMEGYTYATYDRYASNIHYGTTFLNDLVSGTETSYSVATGWHTYDLYWKNEAGWYTATIVVDNVVIAAYTDNWDSDLKIENFDVQNLIFNLNVGCTSWSAFDNSILNLFTSAQMWVDYAYVYKRTI